MADKSKHAHPNYIAIFVALTVLTIIELGVTFVAHFGKTFVISFLMVMAIWKAVLVAMYFMHLKFETKKLRILAVAPLPLAVIMILAVITEYVW